MTDIAILKSFIHLRYVDVSKNMLKDITPLSALTHMLTLKADENLLTAATLDEMPFLQVISFCLSVSLSLSFSLSTYLSFYLSICLSLSGTLMGRAMSDYLSISIYFSFIQCFRWRVSVTTKSTQQKELTIQC